MRVAALYDIHGNLPALEAVLDEIRRSDVDGLVVGGDLFPGPMPLEAIARLLDFGRPAQFIRGNCDRAVLEEKAGVGQTKLPEPAREAIRWGAQQLGPEDERRLASWPLTIQLPIDGLGDVLFCHATPRDDNEIFTRVTPESRVLPAFAGVEAPIVVCGHTHMQFDRRIGSIRVVNAGSVGMPFGEPGAYWLLLGPGVELRRTAYDLTGAAERIRRADYPQAREFADRDVLNPRSEEEVLALFAAAP